MPKDSKGVSLTLSPTHTSTAVRRTGLGVTMAEAGTPHSHVSLVSSDGFTFVVSREAACVSQTICAMLEGRFEEIRTGVVNLQEV